MDDKSVSIQKSKRLMTIDDLCEKLGCSKWTIQRLTAKREIPFIAIGKRLYRFDQDAIEGWLKSQTMKTVAEV